MLCGPASLAVFSCGIRLTPLEAVTDGCSLPKTQRNQALVLLVNKQSIQERYQLSRMLLLGPFRTTHSYFDNSDSIDPTSVSITSGCCLSTPQYMSNVRSIPLTIPEIALIQFLSGGPERTVYLQTTCHWSQGRSIRRWTGEQPTRLQHGGSSSGK